MRRLVSIMTPNHTFTKLRQLQLHYFCTPTWGMWIQPQKTPGTAIMDPGSGKLTSGPTPVRNITQEAIKKQPPIPLKHELLSHF
mmetsp:Transcript_20923/g.45751  ORF Transcript_20923/g.45751 Transcript_20923/m.45751 type:complete len:84 (-) Transcript_20923:66-317(-)